MMDERHKLYKQKGGVNMRTEEPKNYIPEDILELAAGDPRSAFGIMAEMETLGISSVKTEKGTILAEGVETPIQQVELPPIILPI